MLPTIAFPGVVFTWNAERRCCIATFADGTTCCGCVHETEAYLNHAREKSTGSIDLYAWQHDLAHAIVGLMDKRRYSIVLYNIAHDRPTDTPECQQEEDEAQAFQRAFFLR